VIHILRAAAVCAALFALSAFDVAARTGGESRAAASSLAEENAAVDEGLTGVARSVEDRVGAAALIEQFERWNAEADRARDVIRNDAASNAALQIMRDRLLELRSEAQALAVRQRTRIEPLSRELAALGPPPDEGAPLEEPALAALRARLRAEISEENAALAAAQVAAERFEVLLEDLSDLIRERLRLRVLTRGQSPLDPGVWAAALEDMSVLASDIASEGRAAIASAATRTLAIERAPIAALAFVLSLVIVIAGRRRVALWVRRVARDPTVTQERKIAVGVAATVARLALLMGATFLLLFSIVALGLFGLKVEAIMEGVARGIVFVIVTYAFATAYYAPDSPSLRLAGLDDRSARRARGAAMMLAWAVAIGTAVVYSLDRLRFDPEALIVINFLLCLTAALGLIRLRTAYAAAMVEDAADADAHEDEPPEGEPAEESGALGRQFIWLLRHAMLAVAIIAPTLSALGYLAASYELVGPTIRSLGVLGLCALIYAFVRQVTAGRGDGTKDRRGRLRRLAPVLSALLLAPLSAPLFAMSWGASWSDVVFAARRLAEGVEVGGVTLSPAAFLTFAAVFALGYTLVGLLRRTLRTSVLPEMGMEAGARSAVESGVGFAGVVIVALMAISAAGLDLSNLAIVAGALSVGVGFGLQAIVNNFVSGLILLVERPIQVGDWIEVNGIHGTVKRVSVRSTEIETFDRSAYIVPNADLIASPVTNYTHRSALGRLTVKVGVSYATDPRKVEKILTDVARKHPMVLRRPAPAILFRAFGADALEFEIRAFLRDINYIMIVGSDLHFSIAERFRAEGIEIPFGQRDIWFRNADALADALRPPERSTPEPPREAAPPTEIRA
jgi:small-conductance mechanosensitive channel